MSSATKPTITKMSWWEIPAPDLDDAKRLRALGSRLGRAVVDASLTIGMSRGVTHGSIGSQAHADHLLMRAAMMDELARPEEARHSGGILDRVPGWVLILAFGAFFIWIIFVIGWQ